MKKTAAVWFSVFLLSVFFCGCQGGGPPASNVESGGSVSSSSSVPASAPSGSDQEPGGQRDPAPVVLTPSAPGTEVMGNEIVTIDVSNKADGYMTVTYLGDNPKVKLQIREAKDAETVYTYNLQKGQSDVFLFSWGDGDYEITVNENIEGNQYSQAFKGNCQVTLKDQLTPFLYPNQYVKFTKDSQAVAESEILVQGAKDDLEAIAAIYDYVIGNVKYDFEKADTVKSGYLPIIDETLSTKKGICFDYAALMTAMLRVQRIPTKLVVGYAGDLYHAWISVYLDGVGWVDNIIYFDGKDWVRMDPTFAASGGGAADYVGDGSNYHDLYYY